MTEEQQIKHLATWLNGKIDIPYFTEGHEQIGFESLVEQAVKLIPEPPRTFVLGFLVRLTNGDEQAQSAATSMLSALAFQPEAD